jgi:NAD(P)H dehydrogenase (quinone)
MMNDVVLITGVSGHVGRRVAELLAETGQTLRLLVRSDAARAPKLSNSEVVIGDYADSASLDRAFADVTKALVVSVYAEPGKRALLHKNAFDAAARANVGHVVYTSFQGAAPDSKFPYSRDHHLSESYLRAAGVSHTLLRDCLYMDVAPGFFDEHGVLHGPAGNGAVAWVAREDVARAIVSVLTNPGESGAAYDLTGPEALTLHETARRLSALGGRELQYDDESIEQARRWRAQLGAPAWELDVWIGTYLAMKAGELAKTSDAVQRLTGRQPYRLEGYFNERPRLLDNLRKPAKR